jgi:hypothetical protein
VLGIVVTSGTQGGRSLRSLHGLAPDLGATFDDLVVGFVGSCVPAHPASAGTAAPGGTVVLSESWAAFDVNLLVDFLYMVRALSAVADGSRPRWVRPL